MILTVSWSHLEDQYCLGCPHKADSLPLESSARCGSTVCRSDSMCQGLERLRAFKADPNTAAVVRFVNSDMWAHNFGEGSFLVTGPGRTYAAAEDCEGRWLNDAPGQRQYPVSCWRNPEFGIGLSDEQLSQVYFC